MCGRLESYTIEISCSACMLLRVCLSDKRSCAWKLVYVLIAATVCSFQRLPCEVVRIRFRICKARVCSIFKYYCYNNSLVLVLEATPAYHWCSSD